MEQEFYRKEIRFLKGVGPRRAEQLTRLGIVNCGDLVYHRPSRYLDKGQVTRIAETELDSNALLLVEIISIKKKRIRRRLMLEIKVTDGSGYLHLVFFNRNFFAQSLKPGMSIICYGKIVQRGPQLQIVHPEMSDPEKEQDGIVPIYPLTEGVNQRFIRKCMKEAFSQWEDRRDFLPECVKARYMLGDYPDALRFIHFPEDARQAAEALERLAFEEFFYFQLGILYNRQEVRKMKAQPCSDAPELETELMARLGFNLTASQQEAVTRIGEELAGEHPMRVLLQGDVGAGKTVVAMIAGLRAVASGCQVAFLVPTEVLAEQHYERMKKQLEGMVQVRMLTSSIKGKARQKLFEEIRSGRAGFVTGTHALLEEDVEFSKLGLVVIDEQHRFGVVQRKRMQEKGENVHLLVMTATPIPRTLCLTAFGEMEVVVLSELPSGRKPVKTVVRDRSALPAIFDFIDEEIHGGGRAYFVCPLIEESESMDLNHVTGFFEILKKRFGDERVGLLHGRMSSAEKEAVMESFRHGEKGVLVSTTVIEVGVDVPEATVMVIMDADRFGISQLHQLRGRIGRSHRQSYCALITNARSPRIEAVASTADGFLLAERDLEIRGPGEFLGTRQHGNLDFRFGDLLSHRSIMLKARGAAIEYLETDPELSRIDPLLRNFILERFERFHETMS